MQVGIFGFESKVDKIVEEVAIIFFYKITKIEIKSFECPKYKK